MDSPQKIYEKFQKAKKFAAGNKLKRTAKILNGKNKLLTSVSSSEGNGNQRRRRNCCNY